MTQHYRRTVLRYARLHGEQIFPIQRQRKVDQRAVALLLKAQPERGIQRIHLIVNDYGDIRNDYRRRIGLAGGLRQRAACEYHHEAHD